MRLSPRSSVLLQSTVVDPRRIVQLVYIGRMALASAIFVAAVFVWQHAPAADTLLVSLACIGATAATVASAMHSEVRRRPLGRSFMYLQTVADLLLVTAVVHVTGGRESQFAALYILVIAVAALLLPTSGGLLVALLGCVMYFADVFLGHDTIFDLTVLLQLAVFGIVALGSGSIASRLQAAGAGSAELVAELAKVRLQADDILRTIRSGIVTVNADGALLFANPAAGTLLGLDLTHSFGRPILGPIAAAAPELAAALWLTVTERVRTTRAEGQITVGERTFPIGVTTTYAAGESDSQISATAIFQDISDQKRLDNLHLRTERLEAVAELGASLAHEIKNPLAAIRSSVEQLAKQPTATDDSATLSRLIVRESDRLSRLLSEFLDFARVGVAQTAPVDVGSVVRNAANLAAEHPDRLAGIGIACATPNDALVIDGDEDLLHRAFFNLTLNAIQAVSPSGKVKLEVAPMSAEELPTGISFDGGAVAVRVTDDGPGIAPEVRDRLFDPFITTKSGGTGLGLPIAHRAIEAHRGVVFVDSASDGTRFTVLLPRALPRDPQ